MTDMRIGFVGTGWIGESIVELLLAPGRRSRVLAPRDEVRRPLTAADATLAEAVRDRARRIPADQGDRVESSTRLNA
ncbi:hypothetical protein HLB23_13470 [Nocardia uniformis]|uniref:Uncharacterized protein n=1 Tax=Nocardia uniformis TaxID=53432 RepID=A0A849C347_9NOCA|nr:hypothetical protein [Nocardia uniformis]NNH70860.1 hypothetical protein [Nocardia uniformis]